MLRPTSIFNNSPSSSLANSFVKLLGVTPSPVGILERSPVKDLIAESYTSRVQEYASRYPGWDVLAEFLFVKISDDDEITIKFEGPESDRQLVDALEYGTPENPPVSVIRVMELELKQDYVLTKKRFAS